MYERLENAKRLVQTTDRMFNLVSSQSWLVRFMRTVVIPPLAKYILAMQAIKNRFFPFISQIGISYRTSPLSHHEGDHAFAVKAGDRMPWLLLDGVNIYDKLRAPRFHLLTFANVSSDKQAHAEESRVTDMLDYQVLPLSAEVTRA